MLSFFVACVILNGARTLECVSKINSWFAVFANVSVTITLMPPLCVSPEKKGRMASDTDGQAARPARRDNPSFAFICHCYLLIWLQWANSRYFLLQFSNHSLAHLLPFWLCKVKWVIRCILNDYQWLDVNWFFFKPEFCTFSICVVLFIVWNYINQANTASIIKIVDCFVFVQFTRA